MNPIGIYLDVYDEKDDMPTWYCPKCYDDKNDFHDSFEVGRNREGDYAYKMLSKCPKCGTSINSKDFVNGKSTFIIL